MTGAIAIMVKTPGLSPVKTRLEARLDQEIAEEFHLSSARSVAEVVQQYALKANMQAYYAVAEQSALNHYHWQYLPTLWQGEGGLGQRMAHVYHSLLEKHDFVILVGADIPQMTLSEFFEAESWLCSEQPRFAFGPSADGGFWLLGGNCSIPAAVWTDVEYSVEDTGVQFFDRKKELGEIKILSCLRDVDEAEDLLPLRDALLSLTEPLPAQHSLLLFLNVVLENFPNIKKSKNA